MLTSLVVFLQQHWPSPNLHDYALSVQDDPEIDLINLLPLKLQLEDYTEDWSGTEISESNKQADGSPVYQVCLSFTQFRTDVVAEIGSNKVI